LTHKNKEETLWTTTNVNQKAVIILHKYDI